MSVRSHICPTCGMVVPEPVGPNPFRASERGRLDGFQFSAVGS